jgi:hypothetical protein
MNASTTIKKSRTTSATRLPAAELEERIDNPFGRVSVMEPVELLVEQFPGGSVLGSEDAEVK